MFYCRYTKDAKTPDAPWFFGSITKHERTALAEDVVAYFSHVGKLYMVEAYESFGDWESGSDVEPVRTWLFEPDEALAEKYSERWKKKEAKAE